MVTVNVLSAFLLDTPCDPKNRHLYAESVPLCCFNAKIVGVEIEIMTRKPEKEAVMCVIRQVPILPKKRYLQKFHTLSSSNFVILPRLM